jgi:hypothetical protein
LNFTGKYNNSQSQQGDGGSLQPRSYNACWQWHETVLS